MGERTPVERAQLWSACSRFDSYTQSEAKRLLQDAEGLTGCFGKELDFGTGGMRGEMGVGTNRMNRYTVAKATQGLAAYVCAEGGTQVAIAYDSRNRSAEFARIAAGTLAAQGLRAWLYDRLMPTPMLSFAVRALGCDAGIVITASHNPAKDNGYKVYGPDGCQITDLAASAVTAHIRAVRYEDLRWLEADDARAQGLLRDIPQRIYDAFIEKTLGCRVHVPQQAGVPVRVVYTPLHGSGLEPVRSVLAKMPGVEVIEVAEQCVPDGNFPTCPKPNPERLDALALGLSVAQGVGADLLVATDPDCDRVGVAVRAREGYQVLTGNEVGLLMLEYLLREKKKALPKKPVVVKTIVTTDLACAIARAYGAQVVEVLTGFKYIGEAIGGLERAGEGERFVFGFEESCGYLAGTHVRDKDGVMATLLIVEMAQYYASQGKDLTGVLRTLYETYGYMHNVLLDFGISGALPMEEMRARMRTLRRQPPHMLGEAAVTEVRDYENGIDGLPPSDVLSFSNASGCKAIVRPSGTEPKIKVYLSAHVGQSSQAEACIARMKKQAEEWIGFPPALL